jgi:hypothetical protein
MELHERRQALVDALNAHDKEAVKSFIDPSYVAMDNSGKVIGNYWQLLDGLAVLFNDHPEYKQSLEVECLEVSGQTATVTTRRVESLKVLWWFPANQVSRWAETWKSVDGRWMMVEEQAARC